MRFYRVISSRYLVPGSIIPSIYLIRFQELEATTLIVENIFKHETISLSDIVDMDVYQDIVNPQDDSIAGYHTNGDPIYR
jgi:hypothetical protein